MTDCKYIKLYTPQIVAHLNLHFFQTEKNHILYSHHHQKYFHNVIIQIFKSIQQVYTQKNLAKIYTR
jgi:hypothetical protein